MRRAHYTERTAKRKTSRNGKGMGTVPQYGTGTGHTVKAVCGGRTTGPA